MPTLNDINTFKFHPNAIIPDTYKEILDKLSAIQILEVIFRSKLEAKPSIRSRLFFLESRTGSGKSTLMVSYLFHKFGKLICSEPRIVLTTSNANDIIRYNPDMEYGKNIGIITSAVKINCSEKNTCTYCTVQVLADQLYRMIANRHITKGYKIIIIDETHVLDLPTISLVSIIKQFLNIFSTNINCPLFIFTSATIDIESFVSFFFSGEEKCIYKDPTMIAYVLGSSNHPVKTSYVDSIKLISQLKSNVEPKDIANKVMTTYILSRIKDLDGDILVFAPLKSTLLRISELLNIVLSKTKLVFLVSDKTSMDNLQLWREQYANLKRYVIIPYARDYSVLADTLLATAYEKDEEARENETRIIISTPVLETGKTFSDLSLCIDFGLQTTVIYNPLRYNNNKLMNIKQIPANKRQVIQRLGRVGRERPGEFVYFYSEDTYNNLPNNEFPATQNNYACTDLIIKMMNSKYHIFDKFDVLNINDFMYPISIDILLRTVHDLINIGIYTPFGEFINNNIDKISMYALYTISRAYNKQNKSLQQIPPVENDIRKEISYKKKKKNKKHKEENKKLSIFELLISINLELYNLSDEFSAVKEITKLNLKQYNKLAIQSAIKNARNTVTRIMYSNSFRSIPYIKEMMF